MKELFVKRYLNTLEEEAIIKFCESSEWFSAYDVMIGKRAGSMEAIKDCTDTNELHNAAIDLQGRNLLKYLK